MVNLRLSRFALFAVALTFVVITLGAVTRLLDAGLGCPDWPGCYGHLLAPMTQPAVVTANHLYPQTPFVAHKAWAEMVHRYAVGTLSFCISAIILLIFSIKNLRTRGNVVLAVGLIVVLVYQILLGQWTVTLKLLPIVVSQHLLGGFLIVSLLWLVYLHNTPRPLLPRTQLLPWAVVGLVLVFMQIILGAWTSTNYASLSCVDFPFCQANMTMHWQFSEALRILPAGVNYEGGVLTLAARQTIQMMHRFGALIVAIYLFVLLAISGLRLPMLRPLYAIAILLLLQISLGIINVLLQLPLATAAAHTVVAALLLLSMITLVYRLARRLP